MQMNFTDLTILLAYFKSDETNFYHINPNEILNYSFCVEYCHTLDATLPAYTEKPWIQKFILDDKNGFKSTCTVKLTVNFKFETIGHIKPRDIFVLSNFKETAKTWTIELPLMIIPQFILLGYLTILKQKNGIKQIQMNP